MFEFIPVLYSDIHLSIVYLFCLVPIGFFLMTNALRACAERRYLGRGPSQPGHHDPGHGKIDEGLTAGVCALKITGESTVARDPGVGAFDYPSSGQDMKAFGNDLVPVHFHALFHESSHECRSTDDSRCRGEPQGGPSPSV
jgi:hypothetical protein